MLAPGHGDAGRRNERHTGERPVIGYGNKEYEPLECRKGQVRIIE